MEGSRELEIPAFLSQPQFGADMEPHWGSEFEEFPQSEYNLYGPVYELPPLAHEYLSMDPEPLNIPTDIIFEDESSGGGDAAEEVKTGMHPECSQRQSAFGSWKPSGRGCKGKAGYSRKAMLLRIEECWKKGTGLSPSAPSQPARVAQESQPVGSPHVQLGPYDLQDQDQPRRNNSSYNHMLAERSRRSKEKELKSTLMSLIPPEMVKKRDKNSVFQYTIEYIKLLKSQQQAQEETSSMTTTATKFDEVESVLTSSVSNILVQEDGSMIKLSVDTSNTVHRQPDLLLNVLTCVKQLGFEVASILWSPDKSPLLTLTVHTMNSCVSGSQLCETLQNQGFITTKTGVVHAK